MSKPQIINLTDNIQLHAAGGPVTAVVHTGHPNSYQFDLVLQFDDHNQTYPSPAQAGTSYKLDVPGKLMRKANLFCWGAIFTPGPNSLFDLDCEFFQEGASVAVSKHISGQTTGSTVTFSLRCNFV